MEKSSKSSKLDVFGSSLEKIMKSMKRLIDDNSEVNLESLITVRD